MNIVWSYRADLANGPAGFGADAPTVPNVMTVLTPDEAGAALAAGYKRAVGAKPPADVLALLLGQWALETGNGQFVHNYNFGNVKYHSGAPAKVYFRCNEIVNGVVVWYDPPAPQCAFAAYPSADAGAEAYIRILGKRAHWWEGLHTGNVAEFNAALSTSPRYYTADPAAYLRLLKNRVDTYASIAKSYGRSRAATYALRTLGAGALVGVAYVGVRQCYQR